MLREGHGSMPPLGDGFGDDADVGEAGYTKGIDDRGKDAEGNGFVAAEKDRIVGMLELLADLGGELVDIDGIVAEVDELALINRDDDMLLNVFLHGMSFGEIDFNAGLQDGRGDHEDDEENQDDIDEGHHVDVGERRLSGFAQLRHGRSLRGCGWGYGYQISATSDQEARIEKRNSKNEIRKTDWEARRGDFAAIPPLRAA
jgi:hypothetical protein